MTTDLPTTPAATPGPAPRPVGPPTPDPVGWSPGALLTLALVAETISAGDGERRARLAAAALDLAADPAQVVQLKLVLRAFESRAANLLLTGRPTRFADLDQARREAYLLAWATSRIPQRRTAYQGLKRLLAFLAYADPGESGDNPRLHVFTADGRPYLAGTDKRYDIIAVDAYHQPYIPFYLATEEFFRLVRDHLAPGGAVALNVAAVPGDERLSDALGTTMLTQFPSVWRWRALAFNQLLLAFPEQVSQAELKSRIAAISPPAESLVPEFRARLSPMGRTGEPLTDDRAPVEWLADRMILGYAAHGGELEQDLLPTAPGP